MILCQAGCGSESYLPTCAPPSRAGDGLDSLGQHRTPPWSISKATGLHLKAKMLSCIDCAGLFECYWSTSGTTCLSPEVIQVQQQVQITIVSALGIGCHIFPPVIQTIVQHNPFVDFYLSDVKTNTKRWPVLFTSFVCVYYSRNLLAYWFERLRI